MRSRDTLGIPLGPGQPTELLHALGERGDFERLEVFAALLVDRFALFTRPGVRLRSGFFGPVERALAAAGCDVAFVPADFRRFGPILQRLGPRVMATAVAPPDAAGRFSLSLHAGATVAELRRCGRDPERLLIAEVHPKLPRTFGLPPEHPHALEEREIDVLVESDREPPAFPDPLPSDADRAIAGRACAWIAPGSTLQIGIGGVPNAIARQLSEGPGGDYGVHSEMFTTGLMQLHRAGKVTNRKGHCDGVSVCTFAAGSAELYAWLHEREEVRFLPVECVNDPAAIAANRRMVSINGALCLDLAGQVAADALEGRQHSGIGGHEDFVAGASLPAAGRSLLCLPSTARVGDRAVSRIVASFPPGTLVTTPRHQVDVVITEWGAAELRDRSAAERARALVELAHPEFRDALRASLP